MTFTDDLTLTRDCLTFFNSDYLILRKVKISKRELSSLHEINLYICLTLHMSL